MKDTTFILCYILIMYFPDSLNFSFFNALIFKKMLKSHIP